jgi:hypothetical protein
LLAAALVVGGLSFAMESSAGSCTGLFYTYYETPACLVIVGAKVSCPGYPDQIDLNANGTYTHTPWYTVESTPCPCPSGGGGGGGGGGETDEGAPEDP